jgi:hypothetical protein
MKQWKAFFKPVVSEAKTNCLIYFNPWTLSKHFLTKIVSNGETFPIETCGYIQSSNKLSSYFRNGHSAKFQFIFGSYALFSHFSGKLFHAVAEIHYVSCQNFKETLCKANVFFHFKFYETSFIHQWGKDRICSNIYFLNN